MKKLLLVLLLFTGCTAHKKPKESSIMGNWAFLDKTGNYNEAWFDTDKYVTYNRFGGLMPSFKYVVKNDSLYSTFGKKKDLKPVAKLIWLNDDKFIIFNESTEDTLERIKSVGITLNNTDVKADSVKFRSAFEKRYEDFLVNKGILSRKEIEEFKKNKKVPDETK